VEQVRATIENAGYGMVATSQDGQPRVRPMAFVMLDDGRLWSSTFRQSGKVREFATNEKVEVCFLDSTRTQVRIEGVVRIDGGAEERRRLLELNPRVRKHFADEHDERFVHVEIVPTRIRWKAPGFNEHREIVIRSAF
jgi:uncharacterized pyridoxamine 5'-phosphate oxidase family protein